MSQGLAFPDSELELGRDSVVRMLLLLADGWPRAEMDQWRTFADSW